MSYIVKMYKVLPSRGFNFQFQDFHMGQVQYHDKVFLKSDIADM